jgi:hypothetical protein
VRSFQVLYLRAHVKGSRLEVPCESFIAQSISRVTFDPIQFSEELFTSIYFQKDMSFTAHDH